MHMQLLCWSDQWECGEFFFSMNNVPGKLVHWDKSGTKTAPPLTQLHPWHYLAPHSKVGLFYFWWSRFGLSCGAVLACNKLENSATSEARTIFFSQKSLLKKKTAPPSKVAQSALTSWQCNTSGNHHQPATYGDLCLKRLYSVSGISWIFSALLNLILKTNPIY